MTVTTDNLSGVELAFRLAEILGYSIDNSDGTEGSPRIFCTEGGTSPLEGKNIVAKEWRPWDSCDYSADAMRAFCRLVKPCRDWNSLNRYSEDGTESHSVQISGGPWYSAPTLARAMCLAIVSAAEKDGDDA